MWLQGRDEICGRLLDPSRRTLCCVKDIFGDFIYGSIRIEELIKEIELI